MFRLPALVDVAEIVVLKMRIREMAVRLRESTGGRDPREADDIELLTQMISFGTLLSEAGPMLRAAERLGMLPREIGETA